MAAAFPVPPTHIHPQIKARLRRLLGADDSELESDLARMDYSQACALLDEMEGVQSRSTGYAPVAIPAELPAPAQQSSYASAAMQAQLSSVLVLPFPVAGSNDNTKSKLRSLLGHADSYLESTLDQLPPTQAEAVIDDLQRQELSWEAPEEHDSSIVQRLVQILGRQDKYLLSRIPKGSPWAVHRLLDDFERQLKQRELANPAGYLVSMVQRWSSEECPVYQRLSPFLPAPPADLVFQLSALGETLATPIIEKYEKFVRTSGGVQEHPMAVLGKLIDEARQKLAVAALAEPVVNSSSVDVTLEDPDMAPLERLLAKAEEDANQRAADKRRAARAATKQRKREEVTARQAAEQEEEEMRKIEQQQKDAEKARWQAALAAAEEEKERKIREWTEKAKRKAPVQAASEAPSTSVASTLAALRAAAEVAAPTFTLYPEIPNAKRQRADETN
eukprot:TRINITY_DN93013_c0_g1_i1.p1 TRINITY_DN93013_c0_g1~~TRINITY_DN93013_c0_g1_i1.p1  ORF type:complete len:457 (+),score=93.68 TRINITY_DN93013_c0_g1_i1:31-1371(+)